MEKYSKEIAKLKREQKAVDAAISDLECLETALSPQKRTPRGKTKSGTLIQMKRKRT
jgi:hypothetical protein